MNTEIAQTKICKKCERLLPIEKFRLKKGQIFQNPYYSGHCKDCENEYDKEYRAKKRQKEYTFSDNSEIVSERKFKKINKERILDISSTGLDVILLGTDEIFVKLMDYKDTWLSNYGQAITKSWGKYNLMQGSYHNGKLRYTFRKNVFADGKWIY